MTQMQEAENELREMILGLDIGPGERLTERWAGARLGASRTSVRAALFRLESEGLVRRERRGRVVSPIDLRELEQLFVYGGVLEGAAIRVTMSRPGRNAVAGMEALLECWGPDASREHALRVGREFHVRPALLSGNAFIGRGVADAMTRLSRARWLDSGPDTRVGRSNEVLWPR